MNNRTNRRATNNKIIPMVWTVGDMTVDCAFLVENIESRLAFISINMFWFEKVFIDV